MISAIILAAGSGARFRGRKQFALLGGARLVDHAIATASLVADAVLVVLPSGMSWDGRPVTAVVTGGPTRSASVQAGLAALPPATDVVIIHDAAHPLARRELFDAVIDPVRRGADAAVPVLPVTETIGRCADDRLVATAPAEGAVLVQMPHAFRAITLRELYASGLEARDEATLLVQAGRTVHAVTGDPGNLHIARQDDLDLARRLLP